MHGCGVPFAADVPVVCTLVRQDVDEVDDGVGAVLVFLPSSVSPETRWGDVKQENSIHGEAHCNKEFDGVSQVIAPNILLPRAGAVLWWQWCMEKAEFEQPVAYSKARHASF